MLVQVRALPGPRCCPHILVWPTPWNGIRRTLQTSPCTMYCTVSAFFKNKDNYIKTAFFKLLNLHTDRRKIKLIEDNAKCRHLNKLTTFCFGFYLVN